MRFTGSTRWLLLLAAALGIGAASAPVSFAKSRHAQAADPGWLIYRNDRYAFRLSYPEHSRIDSPRAHGVQQISIVPGDGEHAQDGSDAKYHVDVLIYDHRLGHRMKATCRDMLRDAHAVKVGKIKGLRGMHATGEGEGTAAVCVDSKKLEILVKSVDADSAVAERILSSLRFGE
jgi:hypothetical protein